MKIRRKRRKEFRGKCWKLWCLISHSLALLVEKKGGPQEEDARRERIVRSIVETRGIKKERSRETKASRKELDTTGKRRTFFFFLFYSHSQSLWRRRLPSAFRSFVQEQQTSFKDGPKRGSIITFSGRFMIHYDVFNARYLLSFPVCISFFLLKIISNPSGPILPSSLSLRHYHSAKNVGEARTAIISTTRPNEKESESILQHARLLEGMSPWLLVKWAPNDRHHQQFRWAWAWVDMDHQVLSGSWR